MNTDQMVVVGIDPGQKGGIAWKKDGTVKAVPMPDGRHNIFKKLAEIVDGRTAIVAIESVHSMPKQGVSSTFKFGKGYGEILGILTALKVVIVEPTPQAWKKVVLDGTAKDKEAAIIVAGNLFPDVNLIPPGCRKSHDGIADALLIMEWAIRK